MEDGHPGAIIINTDRVPAGPKNRNSGSFSKYMKAGYTVYYDQIGDSYSLLLDFQQCRDGEGYDYFEFKYTRVSVGEATLQWLAVMGGTTTVLKTCTVTDGLQDVGTHFEIYGCYTGDMLYGVVPCGTIIVDLLDVEGFSVGDMGGYDCDKEAGWHAGIKHGNSHQCYFSYWFIEQTIDDRDDCNGCNWCFCNFSPFSQEEDRNVVIPPKLLLTFTDAGGACADLDGASMLLTGKGCSPGEWTGWILNNCHACLSPYHANDYTEDFCLQATLQCSDVCEPIDEGYYERALRLYLAYHQPTPYGVSASPGHAVINSSCYASPFYIGQGAATFVDSPDMIDDCVYGLLGPYNGPGLLRVKLEESTCRPILFKFAYGGTLNNVGCSINQQTGEDYTDTYCTQNDGEVPCCYPATKTIYYDEDLFIWVCEVTTSVAFSILITEAPKDYIDPCREYD
jgi:hypothetical protein